MNKNIDEPEKQPLVSIGIPTYNRPDLLKKSLQSLAKQNYSNIEIIVGDNSSRNMSPIVKDICLEFRDNFSDLRYFSHIQNIGANKNFFFVLNESLGKYFMWMADDYQIIDIDYLSKLIDEIGEKTLIFPLFILSHLSEEDSRKLSSSFESLDDENKDLEAWSENGSGYPFYGLYNRDLLLQGNYLSLIKKCENWIYFNEVLFLHKLFIDKVVKYCPSVRMSVDTSSSNFNLVLKESKGNLIRDFFQCFFEVVRLYEQADLESSRKEKFFENAISKNAEYCLYLMDSSLPSQDSELTNKLTSELYLLKQKIEAMESSKFWKLRKIWLRIKSFLIF